MNPQQIKIKIQELDAWLTEHPTHQDVSQVLHQKRELLNELVEQDSELKLKNHERANPN